MTGNEARAASQLQKLTASQDEDGTLLARFLAHGDEDAFAELVRRHGPMVLGVCRRVLGNEPDADDAFQAAFIVLARKGRSLRSERSVGSYLFGVARFTALRARDKARRRHEHELKAGREPCAAPKADPELLAAMDEELQRLPDRYRAPIVACFLQGRTQEEAARETGCSLSTLRRRLERGQELLRKRLIGRGITPALGAIGAAAGGANVSATFVESTTALVARAIIGKAETVPATILAAEVLSVTMQAKLKTLAAAVMAAVLVGSGVAWQLSAAEPPKPVPDMVPPGAKTPAGAIHPKKPTDPKTADPTVADRIKPGDKLVIRAENVFERARLDQVFEISAGGEIDLGEIYGGKLKIGGLTLKAAEAAILVHLRLYLRNPEIELSRFVPPPPSELELRVQRLEKEVQELRALVEELRKKKP